MLSSEEISTLITKAKNAREAAFVPRSDHKIGACVLTTNGEYFEGCNIEGIISGIGLCAERAAIDHMVIHGKYEVKAVCTVDEGYTYPCGVCLQYMLEFYQVHDQEIEILVSDLNGEYKLSTVKELIPHGYITSNPQSLSKLKSYHK